MRALVRELTPVFLAAGIGGATMLHRIHGTSEGPGALVFYLGAFLGFGVALPGLKLLLFPGTAGEDEDDAAEKRWWQRAAQGDPDLSPRSRRCPSGWAAARCQRDSRGQIGVSLA